MMQNLQHQLDNPGKSIGALLTQALPAVGPFLMLCENSVAAWQKNYEDVFQALTAQQEAKQEKPKTAPTTSVEPASTQAKPVAEAIFLRIIPMQWEIFRFFCSRCEQYFGFISDMMRCQSMSELMQLELAFLSKLLSDYNIEGQNLFKESQNIR